MIYTIQELIKKLQLIEKQHGGDLIVKPPLVLSVRDKQFRKVLDMGGFGFVSKQVPVSMEVIPEYIAKIENNRHFSKIVNYTGFLYEVELAKALILEIDE